MTTLTICMHCKYWLKLPHQYYQERKYAGFGSCSVSSLPGSQLTVMVERDYTLYTKATHGCTKFIQGESLNDAEQIYDALSRQRMSVTYEAGVRDALGWVLGKQPQPELDCAPTETRSDEVPNASPQMEEGAC